MMTYLGEKVFLGRQLRPRPKGVRGAAASPNIRTSSTQRENSNQILHGDRI